MRRHNLVGLDILSVLLAVQKCTSSYNVSHQSTTIKAYLFFPSDFPSPIFPITSPTPLSHFLHVLAKFKTSLTPLGIPPNLYSLTLALGVLLLGALYGNSQGGKKPSSTLIVGGKRNEAIRPMISAGNESRPTFTGGSFLGRPDFLTGPDLGARRCRLAGGLASVALESELRGVPSRWRGIGRGLATVPVPMSMGVCCDEGREV
jgi:hypothetical protein